MKKFGSYSAEVLIYIFGLRIAQHKEQLRGLRLNNSQEFTIYHK